MEDATWGSPKRTEGHPCISVLNSYWELPALGQVSSRTTQRCGVVSTCGNSLQALRCLPFSSESISLECDMITLVSFQTISPNCSKNRWFGILDSGIIISYSMLFPLVIFPEFQITESLFGGDSRAMMSSTSQSPFHQPSARLCPIANSHTCIHFHQRCHNSWCDSVEWWISDEDLQRSVSSFCMVLRIP